MRHLFALLGVAFALTVPGSYEAAIPYFSHVRGISITAPDRQNYIVVDQDLWNHARADLSDIRLYESNTQVPYALKEERADASNVEQEAKILNLGEVGGGTQFDIEVSAPEYDRIRLRLGAINFVATAEVAGKNSLSDSKEVQLGKSTLYDFTREKLGSSFVLQIPTSSFSFLHVRLAPGIKPDQVKGAYVADLQEKKARWFSAGSCQTAATPQHGETLLRCSLVDAPPTTRFLFQVDPQLVNFRRAVSIEDKSGNIVADGDISRVKTVREGQLVVSENLALDVPGIKGAVTLKIENGDDPPLQLTVQPLAIEWRIYFDPAGKTTLKLYSGDDKLGAPTYDYAKFFQEDPTAAEARLGVDSLNPAFTGRPDDRPWSERHKIVLWLAMLLAVFVLVVLAIRGFTKPA
jgi:hypothetical protein